MASFLLQHLLWKIEEIKILVLIFFNKIFILNNQVFIWVRIGTKQLTQHRHSYLYEYSGRSVPKFLIIDSVKSAIKKMEKLLFFEALYNDSFV